MPPASTTKATSPAPKCLLAFKSPAALSPDAKEMPEYSTIMGPALCAAFTHAGQNVEQPGTEMAWTVGNAPTSARFWRSPHHLSATSI